MSQATPKTVGTGKKTTGSSLEIRNVTKRYGDTVALGGVSLTVKPGEFMTLLGPSGSGKTTTLNAIAGFADVDQGEVLLDGVDLANIETRKRGLGIVFQQYALFPHMTVAGNVAFPLEQRKLPRSEIRAQVRDALKRVRLDGFEDRLPNQLSGGQQQRVALARAIVFSPGLLLMDEPLGALDRGLRESMQAELRRLHRELGTTVVLVTHDQEEALALSDRIAVFNNGRIEQVGTGEELYASPQTLFVAGFLGESTQFDVVNANGIAAEIAGVDGVSIRLPRAAAAGGSEVLLIRPEVARVLNGSAAPEDGLNSVPAEVVDDVFLGAGRRTAVKFADGKQGVVRSTGVAHEQFATGDRVWFTWRADDAVLLAADNQ